MRLRGRGPVRFLLPGGTSHALVRRTAAGVRVVAPEASGATGGPRIADRRVRAPAGAR